MINQSRALRYEPVARSMEHLQVLLLDRFYRHKSHCLLTGPCALFWRVSRGQTLSSQPIAGPLDGAVKSGQQLEGVRQTVEFGGTRSGENLAPLELGRRPFLQDADTARRGRLAGIFQRDQPERVSRSIRIIVSHACPSSETRKILIARVWADVSRIIDEKVARNRQVAASRSPAICPAPGGMQQFGESQVRI